MTVYTEAHWVKVATVYEIACDCSLPPTRAVANHFGVSKTAAAKWVVRCRDKGLLPPTRHGVASTGAGPLIPKKIRAVAALVDVDPARLLEAVLSIGGELRVQRSEPGTYAGQKSC